MFGTFVYIMNSSSQTSCDYRNPFCIDGLNEWLIPHHCFACVQLHNHMLVDMLNCHSLQLPMLTVTNIKLSSIDHQSKHRFLDAPKTNHWCDNILCSTILCFHALRILQIFPLQKSSLTHPLWLMCFFLLYAKCAHFSQLTVGWGWQSLQQMDDHNFMYLLCFLFLCVCMMSYITLSTWA